MSAPKESARQKIDDARREIDRIDMEIVKLLSARAKQVRRIGDAKRDLGEPVYQPDREEKIFERVVAANEGPLDDGAIRRLFERILDEARRLERMVHKSDDKG